MKTAISIALRVIALTVILFTCFAVAGGVLGLQGTPPPPGQAGAAGAPLAPGIMGNPGKARRPLCSPRAGRGPTANGVTVCSAAGDVLMQKACGIVANPP